MRRRGTASLDRSLPALTLALLAMAACGAPQTPAPGESRTRVVLEQVEGGAVFDVVDLDAPLLTRMAKEKLEPRELREYFSVYTGGIPGATVESSHPLLGSYSILPERLRFTPDFPLQPGLTYTARLDLPRLAHRFHRSTPHDTSLLASFSLPRPQRPAPTGVAAIYPSADRLPENLLRFYVHFSAPMSRGSASEHVHLMDDRGREIDRPFHDLDRELWDPQQTRLTLMLDPGRIKRGLEPHDEAGPSLDAGRDYRLVIDAGWPDANGFAIESGLEKGFEVVPADRSCPRPADWTVFVPAAGSQDRLRVVLHEPLDRALLARTIQVVDAAGGTVDGSVDVHEQETVWSFQPGRNWEAGRHSLVVSSVLEDLAGNNLINPFDLDAGNGERRVVAEHAEGARVEFEVEPAAPWLRLPLMTAPLGN